MTDIPAYLDQEKARLSRRHFLSRSSLGLGSAALASLLDLARADGSGSYAPAVNPAQKEDALAIDPLSGGVLKAFHFRPKAKRIIYLFMSGGPSQLDLFDYKPLLNRLNGEDLPESVRKGQRLTGMSANQATLPMAGSIFKFCQARQVGWMPERSLAPHCGHNR